MLVQLIPLYQLMNNEINDMEDNRGLDTKCKSDATKFSNNDRNEIGATKYSSKYDKFKATVIVQGPDENTYLQRPTEGNTCHSDANLEERSVNN